MDAINFDSKWPEIYTGSEALPAIINNDCTCYGNTLLQVFNHTPALINRVKSNQCVGILKDYFDSLEQCLLKKKKINADQIVEFMTRGSKDLVFGRFNDTSELLMNAISKMPENNNTLKEIFCCENSNVYCCKHCGNEWRSETNQHVRVNLGRTITESLAEMSSEKDVDGQRTCSECKVLRNCTERFVIEEAPPVLSVKLPTSEETNHEKLERMLFPEKLNLRPYTNAKKDNAMVYSLYAVVVFIPGHYYACCKAPSGQWCKYNDTLVEKVSLEKVLSSRGSSLYYQRSPELDDAWDLGDGYLKQEELMIKVIKDIEKLGLSNSKEEVKETTDYQPKHKEISQNKLNKKLQQQKKHLQKKQQEQHKKQKHNKQQNQKINNKTQKESQSKGHYEQNKQNPVENFRGKRKNKKSKNRHKYEQ